MDAKKKEQIFNDHAFHKGELDKPFAMVRSDFYQACEAIEKHLHNELLMKYNIQLVKAMNKFGWEPIYAAELTHEIMLNLNYPSMKLERN